MKFSDIAVVGVFQDRAHANEAFAALIAAGFDRDQIGVAFKHPDPKAYENDLERDAAHIAESPDAKGPSPAP
ncbi:MAG: hypothetical protein U0800_22500 [Isosphaeraceae bacterium]